jgi:hypothetical protein
MRISRDPLSPLRSWKELFLGERAGKIQKESRNRHREEHEVYSPMHMDQSPALAGE